MQPDNPTYRVTFVTNEHDHVEYLDAPGALAAMEYTSFVYHIPADEIKTQIWE